VVGYDQLLASGLTPAALIQTMQRSELVRCGRWLFVDPRWRTAAALGDLEAQWKHNLYAALFSCSPRCVVELSLSGGRRPPSGCSTASTPEWWNW
jgi:hypothetical protein